VKIKKKDKNREEIGWEVDLPGSKGIAATTKVTVTAPDGRGKKGLVTQ